MPRGCAGLSRGLLGGVTHDAWCSPVWSVECLAGRFGVSSGGS
jgi:hypothetical protein